MHYNKYKYGILLLVAYAMAYGINAIYMNTNIIITCIFIIFCGICMKKLIFLYNKEEREHNLDINIRKQFDKIRKEKFKQLN